MLSAARKSFKETLGFPVESLTAWIWIAKMPSKLLQPNISVPINWCILNGLDEVYSLWARSSNG